MSDATEGSLLLAILPSNEMIMLSLVHRLIDNTHSHLSAQQ